MHVKDKIAKRYLEVFREEIAAGKTNANTPWLDLDVEAYRAYSRGERDTLPGPTYTDGPVIRLMGFTICGGLWENPRPDTGPPLEALEPGSEEHRQRFLPFGLAIVARRET